MASRSDSDPAKGARPRRLTRPRVRPLLVRSGARFTCHGDGLCCTDVHLLGPVAERERLGIEQIATSSIVRGRHLTVLAPQADGHCVFLSDHDGCRIYESGFKPRSCHRYPFLLAATPEGGRVATDHRCPCRTMGEREPVAVEKVAEVLTNAGGRLWPDRRIGSRIRISHRSTVSFARYRVIEDALFESLAHGRLTDVVGDGSLLMRGDSLWDELASALDRDTEFPSRWSLMQRAFARAMRALGGAPMIAFARPWAESFERAERRSKDVRDPEEMLADWIADVIWALEWASTTTLTQVREELGIRVAIARRIAAHLIEQQGIRADTAMAEAIAIVEVSGLTDAWTRAVAQLKA